MGFALDRYMMTMNIKHEIVNEVEKVQRLGFDSVSQAIRAMLDDNDFVNTWDLKDEPKLVGLIVIAKQTKIWG